MENPNYKSENIERKYLNNMRNNQFLKVKNNLLELEKDFVELKDRELKDRRLKSKKEIEELFYKPIIVSIDDTDKFEQKRMKKIRPIKKTWYDWLINYIPEPKTKTVCGFNDKIISLFNTSTPKQTTCGRGKKLSKPKKQKQNKSIRNSFILKEKKIIDRMIKEKMKKRN